MSNITFIIGSEFETLFKLLSMLDSKMDALCVKLSTIQEEVRANGTKLADMAMVNQTKINDDLLLNAIPVSTYESFKNMEESMLSDVEFSMQLVSLKLINLYISNI